MTDVLSLADVRCTVGPILGSEEDSQKFLKYLRDRGYTQDIRVAQLRHFAWLFSCLCRRCREADQEAFGLCSECCCCNGCGKQNAPLARQPDGFWLCDECSREAEVL